MIYRHLQALALLAIGAAAAFCCGGAAAQAFPEGRITMVVGFGAGGMTDVTSRMLANKLEKLLGTTVVVENKGGAGGTLAIKAVGQMEADGNTLVSFLTDGPKGRMLAGIVVGLVVLQFLLAVVSFGLPALGVLHGINGLAIAGVAGMASRRAATALQPAASA